VRRTTPAPTTTGVPALVLVLAALTLAACSVLVAAITPAKTPRPSESGVAQHAAGEFWRAFRDARYDAIPAVRELLTVAYAQDPNDPYIALLLGHTHFWKAAERWRTPDEGGATIIDHLILAERYLEEAHRLAPQDLRIPGWLGGLRLALGNFHGDERLKTIGYLTLRRAMSDYVEFNGFAFAYPMINQPAQSPFVQEAVDAMCRTVERCNEERYDRLRPRFEYARFGHLRTSMGRRRVCWNTELVPHNMEGFFLHFGDLLLKAGYRDAARAAWLVITDIPEFRAWRFKDALKDRLTNFERWALALREDDPSRQPPFMLRSPLACTGCHAT
jgi:hypothetical protein